MEGLSNSNCFALIIFIDVWRVSFPISYIDAAFEMMKGVFVYLYMQVFL